MSIYVHYQELFPKTEEIRHLWILDERKSIRICYVLNESYCADRNCDCRMVRFYVTSKSGQDLAVISYHLDGNRYRDGPNGENPYIEPFTKQGPSAREILALVTDVITKDADYRRRLERHYRDVKEYLHHNPNPKLDAAVKRDDELMNDLISSVVFGKKMPARNQNKKRRTKRKRQRLARKQQRQG